MPRPSAMPLLYALLALALPHGAVADESPATAKLVTPGAVSEPDPGASGVPLVLRGTPATPPTPAPRAESASDSDILVTAGDELWVLDRSKGTLSACELVGTTQVGRSRIDCTTHPWRGGSTGSSRVN